MSIKVFLNKILLVVTISIIVIWTINIIKSKAYLRLEPGISATVTRVDYKQNIAEDGHYSLEIKDKGGKVYTINATGMMNSPFPEKEAIKTRCEDVPQLKIGREIKFRLPKTDQDTFDICYDKNENGNYFFEVVK